MSLVSAKTRVAPLKQQSLSRVELCAALLLSQLIRSIPSGLSHKNITVFAWSDSSIVLSWLSNEPAQQKTFVGNRTSEILDTIPRKAWRHVDSKSNPADRASRGRNVQFVLLIPIGQAPIPNKEEENLYIDIFYAQNFMFITCIDSYSKYLFVKETQNKLNIETNIFLRENVLSTQIYYEQDAIS